MVFIDASPEVLVDLAFEGFDELIKDLDQAFGPPFEAVYVEFLDGKPELDPVFYFSEEFDLGNAAFCGLPIVERPSDDIDQTQLLYKLGVRGRS